MSEDHNTNIQVVARFRPLNQLEKQMDSRECVDIHGQSCKINVSIVLCNGNTYCE